MDDMALGLRDVYGRSSRRLEMIAENLANASTPGYRAGDVISEPVLPFNRILNQHVAAESERDATDLTPGAARVTDRPLDFAIAGDGFFVVRSSQGEYLTRNGSFEKDDAGVLRTSAGQVVMDSNNTPITIPENVRLDLVHAGEDGVLRADGKELGRLRIDRVPDERDLQRVGTTLFSTPAERRVPAESARVLDRTLETSNTVVFQELSNMMLLTRSVEALQKAQSSQEQAQRKMMDALSS